MLMQKNKELVNMVREGITLLLRHTLSIQTALN